MWKNQKIEIKCLKRYSKTHDEDLFGLFFNQIFSPITFSQEKFSLEMDFLLKKNS